MVKELIPGELGARSGLLPGDRIVSINGSETADILDFQVQSAEEDLCFEIEREGERYEVEIERSFGESFGIEFEDLRLRSCNNKCVFCFIHQMPSGLRKSLYFEDDDFRLSFLHGSYVTLTNVKERDIARIVDQGLTPQYISVHATEAEVRLKMLGRKKATVDIIDRIKTLAEGGIEMHTQVVVCPGWNDGVHLERTVADLRSFYPAVRSVALVPVGLTRFRDDLPDLTPVTPPIAQSYLKFIDEWGQRFRDELGECFVYGADELFLISNRELPPASYYDAFPQLENGIGMVRSFLDTWDTEKSRIKGLPNIGGRFGIVTGELAARFMEPIVAELNDIDGITADLIVVQNAFFGGGISVSGLLAGQDICESIKKQGCTYDGVLLPPNCVNGEGVTLDDMTVPQMSEQVAMSILVGEYDIANSICSFLKEKQGAHRGQGRQLSELGYYVGKQR